jgi:ABC-2 type transport system permease protein
VNSVVWLIARREIDVRTQSKAWRIGFLLTIVVIGVGAALPGLLQSDSATTYTVGVAADQSALRPAITAAAQREGAEVEFRDVASADAASSMVEDGDVDAAVVAGRLFAKSATTAVVPVVQSAVASAEATRQLTAAGLSADQVNDALTVQPLPVTTIDSDQDSARQALATIIVVFFFAQLITFCTWVGSGVVEEKASRVVEVLLGAVRPLQLLAGKILGIGAIAVGQAVAVGVVALVAADLAGSLDVPPSLYGTVAIGFVWFILGFAFFATLAAALASLVSHQEEVGGAMTPMTLLLFVAYGASFFAAGSPDGLVARIASFVPPLSALAMPGRIASTDVPAWQVAVAMVLMVAATAGVLVIGARLYRTSILHTGKKLSLAAAWRAEPLASR